MSTDEKPEVGAVRERLGVRRWRTPATNEVCPKCGTETTFGFGLAGGGYGSYVMCQNDACDFFAKRQSED